MSTQLPGKDMPNPPPLPGAGAVQPTAEEKAYIEAKWATMTTAPKILADLILLIDAHPELVEWAKASQSGTLRFP